MSCVIARIIKCSQIALFKMSQTDSNDTGLYFGHPFRKPAD